jgi:NhaP-type Na+/H+ or K+/H+ antiporter
MHTYGFLSVFAAGLALRKRERHESRHLLKMFDNANDSFRTDTVSGHMAFGVLEFNEQLERMGELTIVILLGAMISREHFIVASFYMVPFLLVVARPLSVFMGLGPIKNSHKILISWFGIRGIGSLYYLAFAVEQGLSGELSIQIVDVTLVVVGTSVILHGLSAAPLMIRHSRLK